jgi:hypothetical protein
MTTEERQAYFDQNGVYPIEDSDIPEAERMTPPTAEQIIEGEAIRLKLVAKQYLKDTDWYVSRKAEAGIAIPDDILALRQQARLDASS